MSYSYNKRKKAIRNSKTGAFGSTMHKVDGKWKLITPSLENAKVK